VTPTESMLDDDVLYASIPAWDGQMGIMWHQSPMLTKLGIGSLRLDFPEGGSRWYLIEEGFAQMQNDVLTLLAQSATPAEKITIAGGAGGTGRGQRARRRNMRKIASRSSAIRNGQWRRRCWPSTS
jgi:F-type H+-transporting ATPase subunit epsilon